MQRINEIIKAVSMAYGCTPEELTTLHHCNKRRSMRTKILFYFCIEAINNKESEVIYRDIGIMFNSSVLLILNSHKLIKDTTNKRLSAYFMIQMVKYQLDVIENGKNITNNQGGF